MPRILSTALSSVLALLLFATLPSAASDTSPHLACVAPCGPSFAAELPSVTISEVEAALFNLTNAERTSAGLAPLAFDTELLDIARARASDQISEPTLTHYNSAGQLVFSDLIVAQGLPYQLVGENLARVVGPVTTSAQRADAALMASPLHRANILEPSFTRMAVGSVQDGSGRIVFAQIFRAV